MARKKKNQPDVEPFSTVIEWKPLEILQYMRNHHDAITEAYTVDEINAVYSRCFDDMYTDDEVKPNSNRRDIWLGNHVNITMAIHRALKDKFRMPTVTELSKETKLSRVTVTRHLKHFELDEYLAFHRNKWKFAAERVLTTLYNEIYEDWRKPSDRQRAMALFLKNVERFTNPVKPAENATHSFIQVNNVYITPKTIMELPEEKRRMIETIILESNLAEPAMVLAENATGTDDGQL